MQTGKGFHRIFISRRTESGLESLYKSISTSDSTGCFKVLELDQGLTFYVKRGQKNSMIWISLMVCKEFVCTVNPSHRTSAIKIWKIQADISSLNGVVFFEKRVDQWLVRPFRPMERWLPRIGGQSLHVGCYYYLNLPCQAIHNFL